MIFATNVAYLWNTVVNPRLGAAYVWGTFDCSMAVSQELEAMLYGPAMSWARQFSTMSFAGVTPGERGPFDGIASTTGLICIAAPSDAPADAAMIIAINQNPNPEDAHMICQVQGIDIEMGGQSDDYHTSTSDPTCATITDSQFNQWLYLPGPILPGDPVTTLFGVDVSNNNFGGPNSPNLTAAAAFVNALPGEGFSWIEAKATQGSTFVDPTWATIFHAATALVFPIVAFHYVDTTSPAAQAQNAVSVVGAKSVGWMLDMEAGGGDIANFQAVLAAFGNAGLTVVVDYLPQWYLASIGSPSLSGVPGLISSAYPGGAGYASTLYEQGGGDQGEGWAPYDGEMPVIWQFTDAANVAGITVDADAFVGSQADLLGLLVPGTTPAPTPTPTPPPIPVSNPPAIPKPADEPSQISDLWDQLLLRWDMLNNRTLVEAIAEIGQKLGLPYTPPAQ